MSDAREKKKKGLETAGLVICNLAVTAQVAL